MLETIEDQTLNQLTSIKHAFFTRKGGVSQGRYTSLNCAYASKDDQEKVRENRARVTQHLGNTLESLITVKNTHSNKAIVIDQPWQEQNKPEADAMVTRKKGIILGSDSADCPIVLFADTKENIIALAHAGWRGAKTGILESTIKQMTSIGANPNNIIATISPCITQTSYEVSNDFYREFVNDNAENDRYFINSNKQNHFMFDLPGYVAGCLEKLNLKSINLTGIDTYQDKRFFSCRRSFHNGEDDFGGHFSAIGLR